MRVLLVTSHLELGGVAVYTRSLAKGLIRRGHAVTVASAGGALRSDVEAVGASHLTIPLRTKQALSPGVARSWWRLRQALADAPPEIIHAQTRVAACVAETVARSLRVPYVTTWHGFFRHRLGRKLWPCYGARIIAISPQVRDHLLRDFGVAPARVTLVANGIDLEPSRNGAAGNEALRAFRQRHGLGPETVVIGTVVRLVPMKGVDQLLRACAPVMHRHPQVRLLIVGDGMARASLEALAQQLGIVARVIFAGTVETTAVPLACMRLFVFPVVRQEGFGLAVLEAMAAGLPVIASAMGGLVSIITHGETGLLVPPANTQALEAAIERLLTTPAEAQRRGTAGRAQVERRYTLERMAAGVEAVYQEVLHRR